jgi:hydrogenase maturation protein HypF
MLDAGVHCPLTTSVGRLFDGAAALCGLSRITTFEGQAAMALEQAASPDDHGAHPLPFVDGILDWHPMIAALLHDLDHGVPVPVVAARFHDGLAEGLAEAASALGEETVALTGGCFANARLTRSAARALRHRGHRVLLHRLVPSNDGGIALGQLAIAGARLERSATAQAADDSARRAASQADG